MSHACIGAEDAGVAYGSLKGLKEQLAKSLKKIRENGKTLEQKGWRGTRRTIQETALETGLSEAEILQVMGGCRVNRKLMDHLKMTPEERKKAVKAYRHRKKEAGKQQP